ncbi:MAG: DUF983 domain-containing protein [bacterium]|nr:DUF983 domain-containing protein [bacterium]
MQYRKQSSALKKLWCGVIVRCPNCERGAMFQGLFRMNATCPVCGVRFERRDGESLGGMMFTLGFAEVLSVGGFFLTEALFAPPLLVQLAVWTVFTVAFCVLFYRSGRGLWVSVVYLTGGVYRDDEAPPPKTPPTDWTKLNR